MKKILLTILTLLFTSVAYAEHEADMRMYYFAQVPALCSTPAVIDNYLNHFELEPYHLSLGREGMEPQGQPVYMVTYYVSKSMEQSATTIDVPSQAERCILFHSFDLTKPSLNTN